MNFFSKKKNHEFFQKITTFLKNHEFLQKTRDFRITRFQKSRDLQNHVIYKITLFQNHVIYKITRFTKSRYLQNHIISESRDFLPFLIIFKTSVVFKNFPVQSSFWNSPFHNM